MSPLFPGYLLINPTILCVFLLPSYRDNADHWVIFVSLSTGGLQIRRQSMPFTVHPPTRSVSMRLLVSLLIWKKMEGTFPWLGLRVGLSSFSLQKWPGMLVKEVCFHTHMPKLPYCFHLLFFLMSKKSTTINKITMKLAMKMNKFPFSSYEGLTNFVHTILFISKIGG